MQCSVIWLDAIDPQRQLLWTFLRRGPQDKTLAIGTPYGETQRYGKPDLGGEMGSRSHNVAKKDARLKSTFRLPEVIMQRAPRCKACKIQMPEMNRGCMQ